MRGKIRSKMEKFNPYDALSTALLDGMGNTSHQQDLITPLFIRGLFDEINIETIEGENGQEYHAEYDGYTGMGFTPALAVKDLLQSVVDGLYFVKNGQP